MTYSASIDWIIQPDPSLIQLSNLLETLSKDLSRLSSGPITLSVVESKQTGATSLSVSVIWYLKSLISFNKSSKKSLILDLLIY